MCPLITDGREEALARAKTLPSLQISDRAVCDLEMLACGAFSPVGSFMGRSDYERVLHEMRVTDGTLFPMPITLPIPDGTRLPSTGDVALRDAHNVVLAILRVEDVYEWNYRDACLAITGTTDPAILWLRRWHRGGRATSPGNWWCWRHRHTMTLKICG